MLLMRLMWNMNPLKSSANLVVAMIALSIVGFTIMSIVSLGTYSMKFREPLSFDGSVGRLPVRFGFDPCAVRHHEPQPCQLLYSQGRHAVRLDVRIDFDRCHQPQEKGPAGRLAHDHEHDCMLFSFFFVAIAVLSVEPFRCATVHPFGESALDKKPDVVCSFEAPYGEQYGAFVGLAVFAVLVTLCAICL